MDVPDDDNPDAMTTTPAPMPVVPIAPMRRFCTRCGAELSEAMTDCTACVKISTPKQLWTSNAEEGGRLARSAVGLYFALLAVSAVSVLLLKAEMRPAEVQIGASVGMAVLTLLWCAAWRKELWLVVGRVGKPVWYLAGIGCAVVTLAIAIAVITIVGRLWPGMVDHYAPTFLEAGYGWTTIFVILAIGPPLTEELAFRGVIFDALRPALSTNEAIMVSAMMFMILHLSPLNFPHTLAMGVAAGVLRVKSGSIWPGVLLHFVHNSTVVVMEYKGW
jgi:uncharacterized protein